MILLPDRVPPQELLWYGKLNVPVRAVVGIMDTHDVVGCVAGTKPLLIGNTVYGRLLGRAGYLSFYTDTTELWSRATQDPNSYYYWTRERLKLGTWSTPMPSVYNRGRNSSDEPWHGWNDSKIAEVVASVAAELSKNKEIDIACLQYGISHYGFKELFQSRYPEAYIHYAKYKKIPTADSLTAELSKRFPHLSTITESCA